jgi:hypothetical protein
MRSTVQTVATVLALASASAWAQVNIQPNDEGSKAFVPRGVEVSQIKAQDKSNNRVFLHLDPIRKTAHFTEVTQSAKGSLDHLKVSSVRPGALRPVGEFGSRVETEDNEYFGGKVHVVVLTCEGHNQACVSEQNHNTEDAQSLKSDTQTYLKVHFKNLGDAQRLLAELMKLR